jgi:hypothetical protein
MSKTRAQHVQLKAPNEQTFWGETFWYVAKQEKLPQKQSNLEFP